MDAARNEKEQEQIKGNVLSRMKRIEGQIRGIQGMIEDGKECKDILVQVRAVRSALQSANKLILKRYMLKCYAEAADNGTSEEEALDNLFTVIGEYLDG